MICILFASFMFYILFPVILLIITVCMACYCGPALAYAATFQPCRPRHIRGFYSRNENSCFIKKCCCGQFKIFKFMIYAWIVPTFIILLPIMFAIVSAVFLAIFALAVVPLWLLLTFCLALAMTNWFPEGILRKIFCCKCKFNEKVKKSKTPEASKKGVEVPA